MVQPRLRFTVLGPVRAWRDAAELDLGPPKQRAMLALLLTAAGQPVGIGEIVDVLWGTDPPVSAINIVHRQVGALRRLFEPGLPVRAAGSWLQRRGSAYRLDADAQSLDLLRFRELAGQGRLIAGATPEAAVHCLTEALGLWRGPVAADIEAQARSHPAFAACDLELVGVARMAGELAVRTGLVEAVLPALQRAASGNPLDEPLQARLIEALAASGRQAEALAAYQNVRVQLVEELGIEPGPELRAAQEGVLRGQTGAVTLTAPEPIRPAQLPADLSIFTGRRAEIAQMLSQISGGRQPKTVVINAIGGMAGIGKTTLAVHWAHQVADRFPDGQLYVNLRGFAPSGQVMHPGDALRGFLGGLGVPAEAIPVDLDAQSALLRSRLAGRRVLMLLDNARDTEQVRPLLPGSSGCLAIVTSRNQLAGLVAAEGAHPLTLDLLPPAEARDFLARRLGAGRIEAEPEAAGEIVQRCAGLPLALAIVAARAAMRPAYSLSQVVTELRAASGSLDAFSGADSGSDARAVFSWSYRAVSPAAGRMFRLLSAHPGPEVALPAAAALAGLARREAAPVLDELVRAHLVGEPQPGRYALHDLLHAYSAELAARGESDEALHRALDHYLYSAHAAAVALFPQRPRIRIASGAGLAFGDRDAAMTWFATEHANLMAAITAAGNGFDTHVWQLAWSLEHYLEWQGHRSDWIQTMLASVAASERLGDPLAQAHAHRGLGIAYSVLNQNEPAGEHLHRSLRHYEQLGDLTGQGTVLRAIAGQFLRRQRFADGLDALEQALDRYRRAGYDNGAGNALNEIGWCHTHIGNYRTAIGYCEQALEILQRAGNRPGESATWDSLGRAHHLLGEHARALECYQHAVDLRREDKARQHEARSLARLGDVHHDAGDHEAAVAAWHRAADILAEIGDPEADAVRAGTPRRSD